MRPGDSEPGRIWADAELLGKPFTWMQRSRITSGFVDAAIAFIDRADRDGKPFYVNLWPDDVNSRFWPPIDKWADTKRGKYLSLLQEMDRKLGKLFDHIRNNPTLRDNTLVLVCSDNGPEFGAGSAGLFRCSITRLYEGGIRSPLVVWGPGLIPADKRGTKNDTSFLAAFDLVPSLLKITQVDTPAIGRLDGEDVSAALIGKNTASRSAPIFWRRSPERKNSLPDLPEPQPDLAVREGNWKLLCDYDGSNPELYDLANDRAETTSVAGQHPDIMLNYAELVVVWNCSMATDIGSSGVFQSD